MKYLLTILLVTLIFSSGFGQEKNLIINHIPFYFNQRADDFLRTDFLETLIYPKYAYENGIEGKVYVSFTVDANSWVKRQVTNVHVKRSVHPSLDYAAIYMVQNLPNKWESGLPRGIADTISITFPILFDIESTNKNQVSAKLDQKISDLLQLDSLSLDSALYTSKPEVKEQRPIPKSRPSTQNKASQLSQNIISVKGIVIDRESHQPLSEATIKELNISFNVVFTDEKGQFTINVHENNLIEIDDYGYNPEIIKITKKNKRLKVFLSPRISRF